MCRMASGAMAPLRGSRRVLTPLLAADLAGDSLALLFQACRVARAGPQLQQTRSMELFPPFHPALMHLALANIGPPVAEGPAPATGELAASAFLGDPGFRCLWRLRQPTAGQGVERSETNPIPAPPG